MTGGYWREAEQALSFSGNAVRSAAPDQEYKRAARVRRQGRTRVHRQAPKRGVAEK